MDGGGGSEKLLMFLDLETDGLVPIADSQRNLIDSVLKGSLTPLPGEAKVWETPKGRSPECEFGEATAILKTLKLNPNAAVFEFPSPTSSDDEGINSEDVNADANAAGNKLNASSAPFVPNIPIPFQTSHAQTIHINNLTANLNYHVQTPPSVSTAPVPPATAKQIPVQPSVPQLFTVNGAYPEIVNRFPQQMNYQPPVVVYQDPAINMFYQPQLDKSQQNNVEQKSNIEQQKYVGPPIVSVKEKLAAADEEKATPPNQQNFPNTQSYPQPIIVQQNYNQQQIPGFVQQNVNNEVKMQQQQQYSAVVQQQQQSAVVQQPAVVQQQPPAVMQQQPAIVQHQQPAVGPQPAVVMTPPAFAFGGDDDIIMISDTHITIPSNQGQGKPQPQTKPTTHQQQGGRMPIIEEQKQKIIGEAVSYPTPAEVSYPTHTNSQHHAHQNKPKDDSPYVNDVSPSQHTKPVKPIEQSVPAGHVASATPTSPAPAPATPVEQPTSWANKLFAKSQTSSNQASAEKPTARITPFSTVVASSSPGGAAPSPTPPVVPQDIADTKARTFATFLLNYKLSHYSTALLPAGLSNRSNWCFVNAILQALVACPPFYNMFKQINNTIGIQGLIGTKTGMIQAVLGFVKEFSPLDTIVRPQKKEKNRKKEDIRTGACFEPSSVYKMLLNLPQKDSFQVVEGRQEDAEEFLTCLLNGLSDEMTEILKILPNNNSAEEGEGEMDDDVGDEDDWQEVDSRGKHCVTRRVVSQDASPVTPIQSLALGMCRSSLRSGGAAEISATLQPFYTLQLDIQHPEVDSIDQALSKIVDPEEIEGYKNQKTNQIVKATRTQYLEELPSILILHIKRFVYDVHTGGVQKTSKPISFSVDLEIPKNVLSNETRSKFSAKQRQYKLFAVVNHYGKEATKGHYVTDVYHTGYGCWLHCDDGTVTETGEDSVLSPSQNNTPYILFYRRCDTVIGQEKKEKEPKFQK